MFDVSRSWRTLTEAREQPGGDGVSALGRPEMPPPEDGGYHFPFYANRPRPGLYGEYWYFNFTDPQTGLAGIVGYGIFNPGSHGIPGRGALSLQVYEPGDPTPWHRMETFPMDAVGADVERADVRLGDLATLRAVSRDVYRLRARSRDGEAVLELEFQQADRPVMLSDEIGGPQTWEWNSWILMMPAARVRGSVTVQGRRHELGEASTGYHDHSWGIWLLPARTWAWGVAADPAQDFACMFGYETAFSICELYYRFGEDRVRIDSVRASRMVWDPGPADTWVREGPWFLYPRPQQVRVEAESEDGLTRIEGAWRVTASGVLFPSPVVLFEQKAELSGRLLRRDAPHADWTEVHRFERMPGHAEFVSLWHDPTQPGPWRVKGDQ